MLRSLALLLLLTGSSPATGLGPRPHAQDAQDAPDAALDALGPARAQLAAGNPSAAQALLEERVAAAPEDAQAWALLGKVRHAQGAFEAALEAHEKAARFPATRVTGLYNAACANARLGRTEAAFERLAEARAAGFANWSYAAGDPDLASLAGDPRFASYVPATGEPIRFLEEVRVLHEWRGEAAGDQFGWEGRNAGDVDGDGVDDALVSAPYKTIDGPNAGRVYVYSGASGEELFRRDGKPGDFLGIGISPAGDVDGDGKDDVLVGAWGSGEAAGQALVLGGPEGELLLTLTLEEPGDRLGWKVAAAGDVDGDGHDDLLVGAPGAAGGAGRAYLFSGADGTPLVALEGERAGDGFGGCVAGTVADDTALVCVGAGNAGPARRGRAYVYTLVGGAAEPRFVVEPEESGRNLGRMFASFVGDLDADGMPDVYVSDWEDGAEGSGVGRVYVHSARGGERLWTLAGHDRGEGFGIGSAEAGDVDGDGRDDLVVGSWQCATGAASGGKVSVLSGRDGAPLAVYTCATAGETFGFDATSLGDVDGDGARDFLVTAAYSNVNGFRSGRTLVVAGRRPASEGPSGER